MIATLELSLTVIALVVVLAALLALVAYTHGELSADKRLAELQRDRDECWDDAAHCREKWRRATTACARFAAEIAELRGEETPEQKMLVIAHNRKWSALPRYQVQHICQLSPWDREQAQQAVDDAKAIVGKPGAKGGAA